MKRLITATLLLPIALSLAACSSEEEQRESSSQSTVEENPTPGEVEPDETTPEEPEATTPANASRPTAEEVTESILASPSETPLDPETAKCMGKVFADSKVSDDTLQQAVETEGAFFVSEEMPDKDKAVISSKIFQNALAKCFPASE